MRMTCDGLLNKGMMKSFPSAPFQIRKRIGFGGRDIAMDVERKSISAILRGVEFDNIRQGCYPVRKIFRELPAERPVLRAGP